MEYKYANNIVDLIIEAAINDNFDLFTILAEAKIDSDVIANQICLIRNNERRETVTENLEKFRVRQQRMANHAPSDSFAGLANRSDEQAALARNLEESVAEEKNPISYTEQFRQDSKSAYKRWIAQQEQAGNGFEEHTESWRDFIKYLADEEECAEAQYLQGMIIYEIDPRSNSQAIANGALEVNNTFAEVDLKGALGCFTKSADQGYINAQDKLAHIYVFMYRDLGSFDQSLGGELYECAIMVQAQKYLSLTNDENRNAEYDSVIDTSFMDLDVQRYHSYDKANLFPEDKANLFPEDKMKKYPAQFTETDGINYRLKGISTQLNIVTDKIYNKLISVASIDDISNFKVLAKADIVWKDVDNKVEGGTLYGIAGEQVKGFLLTLKRQDNRDQTNVTSFVDGHPPSGSFTQFANSKLEIG